MNDLITSIVAIVLCADSRLNRPLPSIKDIDPVEVGSRIRTPAQEFRFGVSVVNADHATIARDFVQTWVGQGLPVVAEHTPDGHVLIAAFDTARGIQQLVIIVAGDHETKVLSVISDLRPSLPEPTLDVRHHDGAINFDQMIWLDDVVQTNQVNSYVPENFDVAKTTVSRRLVERGFLLVSEQNTAPNEVMFEHRKNGVVAISLLRSVDPSLTAVSQTITEGG